MGVLISWLKGLPFETALVVSLALAMALAWIFERLSRVWHRQRGTTALSPAESVETAKPALQIASHEECERNIRNLESTVARLQRNDETQGIQISAKNAQIEQLEAKLSELNMCPYELVHRLADQQAKVIRDFVTVTRVGVWEHRLTDPVPAIRWGFMVKNNSLFPISLVEVRNNLFFEDTELAERRFESTNEVQQLPPWRQGSVVFEQRLSNPEAQHIKSTPDGKFRFANLVIRVGNPESYPVVEPQPLELGNDLVTTLGKVTYQETEGMTSLRKERDYLQSQLRETSGLAFEIDEKQSQVNTTGGGTGGHRISVKVRLRCMKPSQHPIAIREFHAALIQENGQEKVNVPQEGALVVMGHPDMKVIDFSNGWTVTEPLTDYRWFMFYLDITSEQLQRLSHDHFIRITMIAVGQKPYSVAFDIDNWQDARTSNSYITVRGKNV